MQVNEEDTTSEDFYDVIDETSRDVTASNIDDDEFERSEREESEESSL